jgi:predicted phage terminase large subunit-like protein
VGLTPAQRKANQRAREKGLPEPYNTADIQAQEEKHAEKESKLVQILDIVSAFDKEGKRYKSEARSLTKLFRIYCGQPETGDADEETVGGDTLKKAAKAKKDKRPNPSETKIRIQDSTVDPTQGGRGKRRRSAEDIKYEVDDVVGFWRWLDLRDRARKDLFWLGRLLGKGLYRSVHQITCDQFVEKNFGGSWLKLDGTTDETRLKVEPMYFDGYTLDDFHDMIDEHHQWREREMMLLDSRGFYKSTIDGVDSVQWLLNCPDIRILIITGEYKLAVAFALEIKGYFNLSEGQEPNAFHLLFPEYVLRGVDGTSKEPLFSPARILDQKEGSLWVNSIVANLSGWHCDVKKGDDIVTDENSNSEEAREKIKVKYDGTDDLLDPHGFMDHIGTRYFTDDWYGTRLAPNSETGEVAPIKYHKRGCWTVKPEYAEVPLLQLTKEMVTLNFPQRWSFSKLRSLLLKKGERFFKNQQLNEPTDSAEDSGFKVSFTETDIRSHTYQREAAPKAGDVFIVWDWALSDKKTSDYSVGVVARLYKNDASNWAFVILEIVYDKWKYSELAFQIVSLAKRWGPKVTMIEQSNGYEMLRDEITRVGHKFGYQPYIFAKQPSRAENAKRNRIKSLEILISEHRLHFVLGPWMDETIKQLTQYTGEKKNKGRKDDIPDAMAYLSYLLPANARPVVEKTDPEEEKRLAEEHEKHARKQAQYDRYFGQQLQTRTEAGPTIEVAPPKPQDPRMIIFGNKGPWRL